jgi:S-adenosylmethionine:tRNA ribosyltransferase-isomerase
VDAPRTELRLSDLDFELPEELIAQRPAERRDTSRLLCVRRGAPGELAERAFFELPSILRPGDVLVRNVTRVVPARLEIVKEGTGARGEILLVEPAAEGGWWTLARPARRLGAGSAAQLVDGTRIVFLGRDAEGRCRVEFPAGVDVPALARELGRMPLPPYIRRPADGRDTETYQTVYARQEGSVAAPTAGLHFTPELLDSLVAHGIELVDLVLHVGPGTFLPIRGDDPLQHVMHWERFEIGTAALARLDAARAEGHRCVAIGTTATRTLESISARERGEACDLVELEECSGVLRGRTRLYIHPPYTFRRVDALLTNFHLPRSTLLLLVDAFAGRDTIRAAYAEAVRRRFRFFSYGDAMLIE